MRIICAALLFAAVSTAQPIRNAKPGSEYSIPNSPRRDAWQKPDEVIEALQLLTTDTVAIFEDGYPYFAQRIAPLVDQVIAINTDPRAFEGPGQLPPEITTIVGTKSDLKVPKNVDVIILVEVLRELPDRGPLYASIKKVMKSGGRLVIIDRNLPEVIPENLKLNPADLVRELPASGLKLGKQISVVPYQFMLVFQQQ